jgi:hypothetical protein
MFGMSYQTLSEALRILEDRDPNVRAARIRLDDTIDRLVYQSQMQPEVDKAKREAILGLLEEKYKNRDQEGLDSMIVTAQFRGYDLQDHELEALMMKQDEATIAWWLAPCELH